MLLPPEEASLSTVEHMVHQRVLESMPITAVDQQGALVRNDPLANGKRQPHQSHDQTFLTQEPDHRENTLSLLEKLDIFQRSRLRSFSEYRYTEHHDPNVFPQVLQFAIDVSLCVDSFHSPLDHTLYIVCHSPRSPQRHCYESWETVLHTDVAFRKYQEHVANVISDWTRHEETKREAKQIKNLSLLESPHDTTSVTEETSQEPCIREESLKAWKLDQEQRQQEAEPGGKGGRDSSVKKGPSTAKDKTSTRPKKQEAPGCPTATPPAGQDQTPGCPAAAPPAGQDQTPGCPAAAPPAGQDQTPGCPAAVPPAGQDQRRQPTEDFHGYRMDGQLIHVSGHLQHLFPSDGGRVTVEKVSFVQGSSLIQVAVKKDGHHFFTHRVEMESEQTPLLGEEVRDPGRDGIKCAAIKPQGSFSAVLHDGVRLSFHYEGPAGEHTVCPQEVTQDNPSPASTDVPPAAPCCPRSLDLPASPPTSLPSSPTAAEEQSLSRPFNSLHMSAPNGLTLQFLVEDTQAVTHGQRNVLVRQNIPAWQDGVAVAMPAELSRVITSQGAVVRHMKDGSTEVLFPDGAVTFSPDSGPVWPPVPEPEQEETEDASAPPGRGRWITTAPSGARVCTVGSTHEHIPTTSVLSVHATDPLSQAVMLTRQDRVVCVQEPDGTLTVEHADGTRITSFSSTCRHTGGRGPAVMEEEEVPAEQVVLVERDGSADVMMFPERGKAHVFLADGTVATGDGCGVYQVFPSNAGRLLIGQDGMCVYYSDPTPSIPGSQSGSYRLSTTHRVTCDITDPEGNHFQVQQSGLVSVVLSAASSTSEPGEEAGEDVHARHGEHSPRLFLVHEDGSGTELLICEEAERLLQLAHSDPSVAVLTHSDPSVAVLAHSDPSVAVVTHSDAEGPSAISIVRPVQRRPAKHDLSIVPINLRNRSWLTFPRAERKSWGPPFGSDLGRGLALRGGLPVQGLQVQDYPGTPQVLQVQELTVFPPTSKMLRHTLDTRLKGFMERLLRREQLSEDMRPLPQIPDGGRVWDQRTAAPKLHSDAPKECSGTESERRTETQWAQRSGKYRQELNEDRAHRSALRSRDIVSYFNPENALLHQMCFTKSPT